MHKCKVQTLKKWLEKKSCFYFKRAKFKFFFQKIENNEFLYMYM